MEQIQGALLLQLTEFIREKDPTGASVAVANAIGDFSSHILTTLQPGQFTTMVGGYRNVSHVLQHAVHQRRSEVESVVRNNLSQDYIKVAESWLDELQRILERETLHETNRLQNKLSARVSVSVQRGQSK
jgi:hypothetical protein